MIAVALLLLLAAAPQAPKPPATAPKTAPAKPAPAKAAPAKPAATKPSPEFDKLAKQAEEARTAERADEAIDAYRHALRLRPDWSEGWWFLGTLLYEKDDYKPARDSLRRFIMLDPRSAMSWGMLGLCEYQTGDYDEALKHLMYALRAGLGSSASVQNAAKYHAALLLNRKGDFEYASTQLMELAMGNLESPSLILATGITSLRIKVLPQDLPPGKRDVVMLAGRGVYYIFQRKLPEAERELKKLVDTYPTEPNVHYVYGSFLMFAKADEGIAELKKEIERDPNHIPALIGIVYEYLKRGEPESGLPFARQAAKAAPDDFPARIALGRCLVESGDLPPGIVELEAAVKLAPDYPQARMALASAYAKAGRKEEAARERAEFLKLRQAVEKQAGASVPAGAKQP